MKSVDAMHRVAAIQMVSGSDVAANLATVERLLIDAKNQGAELVVLPEVFALFGAKGQQALGEQEASEAARVRPFIRQQAKQLGLWIVAGTIPLRGDQADRVLASCFVVSDKGVEVARYDKLHLFDVDVGDKQGSYRESDTFKPGDKVVVIDTPFGRLGLAVCYDIRFPEFFRAMFDQGVDIIAVPAAFTLVTGKAHWLPLLRARAIENQCYIIGANQGGDHSPSRRTSGGSVIIDGWGNVLAEADMGEACTLAAINLAELDGHRAAMPIAQHRRFDVVFNQHGSDNSL
ncbi:MAG: carbon-nitrogen hydrolase family protein [Spongiibacteraceae bacterium]